MATYAIGDLQGCFSAFQALLDRIHFDITQDHLWLTGDLINRGPESLETLRFIKTLQEKHPKRVQVVLGNHDMHLLAVAYGNRDRYKPEKDTLEPILKAKDKHDLVDWLQHQPLLHYDKKKQIAMLHAGLPPQWDFTQAQAYAKELEDTLRGSHYQHFFKDMYGTDSKVWSDSLRGMERLKFINSCFTRLRYCNAKGKLLLKNKLDPNSLNGDTDTYPWFSHPKRASSDTTIVFGHWATLGYYAGHNVYGLDSGCVWGGRLTALRLEDKQIFQVACLQIHDPNQFG